jgi:N-acyl-D-aspartate/D-glutamate deacylase
MEQAAVYAGSSRSVDAHLRRRYRWPVHDLVIRNGAVVDGSGGPRRADDVAIDGGRITAMGRDLGQARRTIDAEGMIVAPGFIDVHTHYDAQVFWDPALTPSPLHGVTTVIGGNCGFSVAPLNKRAADYLLPMLARVEGMPKASLEAGVPWDWTSTAEYLQRLDGALGINAGFMVGHSALRRVVMGESSVQRAATAEEIEEMCALLQAGLAAGGLGFSSTWSVTHNDAEGNAVPSRHATRNELIALGEIVGTFPGTSLEFLPGPAPWDAERQRILVDLSVAARRPLNWNLLIGAVRTKGVAHDQLAVSDAAQIAGGRVIGLVLPSVPSTRVNFLTGFLLDAIDGWTEAMALPPAEKLALLSDPAERARLESRAATTTQMKSLAAWNEKVILETFAPETEPYRRRRVADIADEEGKSPFDALIDIVVADGLRTSIGGSDREATDTAEDWAWRRELWLDPRTVVGGSDAGAHLDGLATFSFATELLAEGVRRHQLITTEEAVHLLTSKPASLYGLVDRGCLAVGAVADVVVFDESVVGPGEVTTRFDLPAGAGRLYAEGDGIEHVIVGGESIVQSGALGEARSGVLLRSGRDTRTPTIN